jgi:hypothetical protein
VYRKSHQFPSTGMTDTRRSSDKIFKNTQLV